MTPTEAEAALSKVGLVGKSGDSVNSDDVEVGKIAAQTPAKDTTAKAGSTVTYQLSKGPEEVEVPNVIGWSQSSASDALREAGFTVVVNSEENDTVDVGVVFYQSVSGTASKGSEIVLTVSSGSSKAQVPGVVGMTEGDATGSLAGAGFNVATSYAPSDAIASGYVMSQSLSGMATKGSTVEIQISTGPERPSSGDTGGGSGGGSSSSSTTPGEDTGGGSSTEGGGSSSGDASGGGTETPETTTEHEAATS
jgi:serine/threonine-protein kinase